MLISVVGSRFRSIETRSHFLYTLGLVLLPLLVACAGDLDSRFGQGGSSGSATGGASGTGTGGSGTSGTGGSGAGGATAACDAVAMVFVPKCSSVGCHTGLANALGGPLDLTNDAGAAKAVNAPQAYACAADMQAKIVNPSAPFSGTMMRVISGETCGPGTQMPLGAPALPGLSQAEINCIASYYTAKLK